MQYFHILNLCAANDPLIQKLKETSAPKCSIEPMNRSSVTLVIILLLTGYLVLSSTVSASSGIEAYYGDTITLQGYSYGSPSVYLFLSGPNLPVNGVALNDLSARADEGHFTTVSVDDNDHWVTKWATNMINGKLDAGTYTVWVVNSPTDRSRLHADEYTTISIHLNSPGITTNIRSIPGILELNTTPEGASVLLGENYKGSTPLTIDGIEPGTYTVTFSRFGYFRLSVPVHVEAGKTTTVHGTLIPLTGSLEITTNPQGARILLDSADQGVSPVTVTNISAGNHTVTAIKEGYITTEQSVRILPNQTTPVAILMDPLSSPNPGKLPSSGQGPAITIAGFIVILMLIRHNRSE